MAEAKKTVPTWGYHKTEDPQIFDLKEGEKLPEGWHDTPDKISKGDERPPQRNTETKRSKT